MTTPDTAALAERLRDEHYRTMCAETQERLDRTYDDVCKIIRWVGVGNLPGDPDDWSYYLADDVEED